MGTTDLVRIATPVLLIGGVGYRPRGWSAWVNELNAANVPHRIVTTPYRGFASLDRYVEAIEQTAAELRTHIDAPQISLVGHSKGGVAAVEYLARYPDEVAHVVTIGSPLTGHEFATAAAHVLGSRTPDWAQDLSHRAAIERLRLEPELLRKVTSIARYGFDGMVTATSAHLPGANHIWVSGSPLRTGHAGLQMRNPEVRGIAWRALAGHRLAPQ